MHTMATNAKLHVANAIFIAVLHITVTNTAKIRLQDSGSPVYEVINEQARIDDKPRIQAGNLPYGNPLAGNSKQNARLHAQNQQAMFNAERMRQHRAQLQRWAQISQVDSYMKAYHDSQEDHQLAVEQQQANLRERRPNPVTNKPVTRIQRQKIEPLKKGIRVIPDVVRITKADAVKTEKNRSHRSYGSVDYHKYLHPKMYKTVYVSPAPTYDQGVTIKPNGMTDHKNIRDNTILFTEAVPSKTHYVYPKQYGQMEGYESAQDIKTLNSLLKKNPQEQLSSLNAFISSGQETEGKDDLNSNIDIYFYPKDADVGRPAQSLVEHYENSLYAQIQPNQQMYASAYITDTNDHKPITEEVDDIDDPNKVEKYRGYGFQTATEAPEVDMTTTKNNNYYRVEVASKIVSSGHAPHEVKNYSPEKPEALQYIQPLKYYLHKELQAQGDESERYLHHNARPTGVQHLSEDGSGVSAYSEDSVSICSNNACSIIDKSILRRKRSVLDTSPFILPKNVKAPAENIPATKLNDTLPSPEKLVRILYPSFHRLRKLLNTPEFAVGEAIDLNNFDLSRKPSRPITTHRNKDEYVYLGNDEDFTDYGEDIIEHDHSAPDYEPENYEKPNLYAMNRPFHYAPAIGYENNDLTGSYSNKYRKHVYPSVSYGVPQYARPNSYSYAQIPSTSYGVPNYDLPIKYGPPSNVVEPYYMLTLSQLKSLVGHHNLNIQHLDVYQTPQKAHANYPRNYRKRYPRHKTNSFAKHLQKLHKLHLL